MRLATVSARGLRRSCDVQQVAHSPAVHGGNRVWFAEAELPEFGGKVFAGLVVDLVDGQHDRLAGFAGHTLPDGGGQSRAQTFGDAGQDGVVDVVRSLDVAGGELQEGLVLFQLRQDAYQ